LLNARWAGNHDFFQLIADGKKKEEKKEERPEGI